MARRQPESTWPPPPREAPTCALCERAVPQLTEHHLLPRSQGRHRTFSNVELAREYRDLTALRGHEDVQRFVRWLRTQPATKAVRVR